MSLFDDEAERVVLGSLLQNPSLFSDVSLVVRPEDFSNEKNRYIYEAYSAEVDRGSQPDALLVISHLKELGKLEQAGSRSYIMQVASEGSPVSAVPYARRVREYALRRALLTSLRDVEKETQDETTELEEVLSQTERAIFSVTDRYTTYNVQHVRDIKNEFAEFLRQTKEAGQEGVTGTSTHFKELDQLTTGLKPGQMAVLAARPGMGKTTFGLNTAQNVALLSGKAVLIFSLEMTRIELFLRMVCAEAFVDSQKVQKGMFNQKDMDKLLTASAKLCQADIYIDDSGDLTTWEFRQRSRRWANRIKADNKEIGLIVVDYLQLMSDRSNQRDGRQVEVSAISRTIKNMAKELGAPVLALSQMNRSIEQRGKDPRPQLSDLRESGAIEQDADIVFFIHREDVVNPDVDEKKKNQAELIVAKHRGGPLGTVYLGFLKEKNVFMNLDLSASE